MKQLTAAGTAPDFLPAAGRAQDSLDLYQEQI